MGTLDQVGVRVNVGYRFNRLEQNTVIKMHTEMRTPAHNFIQHIVHEGG